MFIHMFGAFFGVACTFALSPKECYKSKNIKEGYNNELIALIGTIFLWMYWPSFNAALGIGAIRERVILNTVISLTASCIWVFLLSTIMNKGKLKMEDLLNATLAGGVIIGATADICTSPWLAMLIGSIGGIGSILGYHFLTPYLMNKFDYHDTCGVINLHGISGFLGAIICCIVSSTSE